MDATGRWEATRRLREWERRHLHLRPGQRLLDVGCGLGDAALALATDLGETGEVHGVDVSQAMVVTARSRASTARCNVRFSVGDATALDEPNGYYDVVRSERTLQWLRTTRSRGRGDDAVPSGRRSGVAHRHRLVDAPHRRRRLPARRSRPASHANGATTAVEHRTSTDQSCSGRRLHRGGRHLLDPDMGGVEPRPVSGA